MKSRKPCDQEILGGYIGHGCPALESNVDMEVNVSRVSYGAVREMAVLGELTVC